MLRVMLFATASSVLLGSPAPARADDAEDKAVAFVKKIGGVARRDDKLPGKPVVRVDILNPEMADAGLRELAPLKSLAALHLSQTGVTDAGLKELAGFT